MVDPARAPGRINHYGRVRSNCTAHIRPPKTPRIRSHSPADPAPGLRRLARTVTLRHQNGQRRTHREPERRRGTGDWWSKSGRGQPGPTVGRPCRVWGGCFFTVHGARRGNAAECEPPPSPSPPRGAESDVLMGPLADAC